MAALEFVVSNPLELVKTVVTFLTDSNNFSNGNQWTLLKPATIDAIDTEVIIKGVGDGQDSIYVGMKIEDGVDVGQKDLVLNGYAGYDEKLDWDEQPGAISHAKLPTMPFADSSRLSCWLTANTSRFIIVAQMSTQYECCYVGFMKPVAVQRQYPYPLVVAGSYIQGKSWASQTPGHSGFTNPGSDSYAGLGAFGNLLTDNANQDTSGFRLRRPDGAWRSALNKTSSDTAAKFERLCVWPQNTEPTNVLTVLDNSLTIENIIMFPCLLYETHPEGIVGQLDGVYFVGNREDLSSKDTIIHDNKPYKVFSNVFRRDTDEYYTIEWF